ncbi:deoxyribodipyrimidine photolyase [Tardibacter chloracetimidivorans]|uniref:Deoxyribodipyrimidine photolyase n=1 Tax=Tardibacter chloracetimidivorans TaxID=1921510 RepID=A0A1L3ZYI0_9SPHN|nr:deoxyribodipyrimidine photo-lyase [Tardibacter chloracetimidivorans]API60693.1 deoxyribodipyrimidine photolyase [Tardibacter chloracetimidivorans]
MAAGSILWFRQDLRLFDQPAVRAVAADGPVLPVYVLDDETPGDWRIGAAQRWWLHHSLKGLSAALEDKGAPLLLLRGKCDEVLAELARETGIRRVHAVQHHEPWWRRAEARLAKSVELVLHHGATLAPPEQVTSRTGASYRVFTPFWRALLDQMPPHKPEAAPQSLKPLPKPPRGEALADWKLLPRRPDWAKGFDVWTPGEEGAKAALRHFLPEVADYDATRNLPSVEGTSRLSPHLHFGEISPATVWHMASKQAHARAGPFLRELAWRDFALGQVQQFPRLGEENGREQFDGFSWRSINARSGKADFEAWTRGRTGYPIIDAGMRQLWATGWMHNRVRMIAASFLIKHLLIDWQHGARWFWGTLVDADYGNNSMNWQWVAGTGVDSAPFYRIMAPLSQSAKFNAADYIREWVPELSDLDDAHIHEPWTAPSPPAGYPEPLIGHAEARARALAALDAVKSGKS